MSWVDVFGTRVDANTATVESVSEVFVDRVLEAPHLWLDAGLVMLKAGRGDLYEELVLKGISLTESDRSEQAKNATVKMRNSLVRYYIEAANSCRDSEKRREWHRKGRSALAKISRVDKRALMSALTTAQVMMADRTSNSRTSAQESLREILSVLETYVPAKVTSAELLFQMGEYKKALIEYSGSLLLNPEMGAEVRVSMALCFVKMGKEAKAKAAFERALAIDAECLPALIGLALVKLNEQDIEGGMKLIGDAYAVSPNNPIVLNQLANHYFYKGEHDTSMSLAYAAFQATNNKLLQAESAYLAGRVYHVAKDIEKAYDCYRHAVTLRPNYALALFGVAQLNIARGHPAKSLGALKRILKAAPNNFEALSFIGSIYASQRKVKDAVAALSAALAVRPDDVDTLIEYAELIDSTRPQEALDAYLKAHDALAVELGGPDAIPAALHNNIAVLHGTLGNFDAAAAAFEQAYAAVGEPDNKFAPINRTLTFNLARAHENAGHFADARALYEGLLEVFPGFVDCHLRLGCIARELGDMTGALDRVKDAFAVNENDINAWSLMGSIQVKRKEFQPGQKAFEHILGKVSKSDAYSLIALGNIFYHSYRPTAPKTARWLDKALSFFKSVLRNDSLNVYAANGIGMVLADRGDIAPAKIAFEAVRSSSRSELPDVYINLAHCALAQKQFSKAITLYSSVLHKHYDGHDVMVLLFIARALFDQKKYKDANRTLTKVLHIDPTWVTAKFDLALCLLREGEALLNLPEAQRPVPVAERALRLIRLGKAKFKALADAKEAAPSHLLKQASSLLERGEIKLEAAREREELRERDRAKREAEEAKRLQALKDAEAAAEAAAIAAAAEREARIKDEELKLATMREIWATESSRKKRKKRKKKRKHDEDAPPPDAATRAMEMEWDDDQDNPYLPGADSSAGADSDPGLDDAAGASAAAAPAAEPGPVKKKRKTLGDDSSDSDE